MVIHRGLIYPALALLAAFVSGACLLNSGSAPRQEVVSATPVALPTPTARPPATSSPTPTRPPVTNLGRSGAEALVWSRMHPCADQIVSSEGSGDNSGDSSGDGSGGTVAFTSTDSVESETWLVEASTGDSGLSFGRWEVADATGLVTPVDQVASAIAATIASDAAICARPAALLARGLTPPLFPTSTPTPAPTPTVVPTATPNPTALPPTPTATPTAVAATGEQARLRVWVAVRSCFNTLPPVEVLTAYQDQPQRWIVEGRDTGDEGATVTYGLWFVDASTGQITPSDLLAQRAAADESCFKNP